MGANHAITEPAVWDNAPPVVPDLDADMDDATSVIEAFVTKLGKRTQWLRAAILAIPAQESLLDYARKSVANTFAAVNTFTAKIETRDIDVRGGGNVDVDGGVHADGTITSDAGISTAHGGIRADEGEVRGATLVSDGTLTAAGHAEVATLNAIDGDVEGATVTSRGDIFLPGSNRIRLTGSDVLKGRWKCLPLDLAQPAATSFLNAVWRSDSQTWFANGAPAAVITIPFPNLPSTCIVRQIQVFVSGQTNSTTVEFVNRFADWDSSVVGNVSTSVIGTPEIVPTYPDADYRRITLADGISHTLDSAYETLALRVTLGDGSVLGRARVLFQDVGPRSE